VPAEQELYSKKGWLVAANAYPRQTLGDSNNGLDC